MLSLNFNYELFDCPSMSILEVSLWGYENHAIKYVNSRFLLKFFDSFCYAHFIDSDSINNRSSPYQVFLLKSKCWKIIWDFTVYLSLIPQILRAEQYQSNQTGKSNMIIMNAAPGCYEQRSLVMFTVGWCNWPVICNEFQPKKQFFVLE